MWRLIGIGVMMFFIVMGLGLALQGLLCLIAGG